MAPRINARLFLLLVGAGVLTTVAVIPYTLSLGLLDPAELPAPLPVVLALQVVQTGILIALATWVGLRLGPRVGLGAPYLEAMVEGEAPRGWPPWLALSAGLGAAAAVAIFLLDTTVFAGAIPPEASATPPLWTRLLGALYGGVAEELLLRLGLMTLLTWLTWTAWRAPDGGPANGGVWLAIVLTALLFGALHLPATIAVAPLTPLVAARALVLNGVGGVAFGWLYWRHGLAAAMAAHLTADVLLHGVLASLTAL